MVLRKVRCRYDKAGRLLEKREILDSGLPEGAGKMPAAAVTSYTYDANGNRTGTVTPEGYRISREYDCRDRLSMERVQDRGNGIDLRTFFAYDNAGNVASVRQQDAGGKMREVRCSHDLKDRLTRLEELDGPVVQAAYDRNDRMSGRTSSLLTGSGTARPCSAMTCAGTLWSAGAAGRRKRRAAMTGRGA